MPSAMSSPSEPVEIASTSMRSVVRAELHDGALAELLLDVGERGIQRLMLVHLVPLDDPELRCGHGRFPLFHELQVSAIDLNVHDLFLFAQEARRGLFGASNLD